MTSHSSTIRWRARVGVLLAAAAASVALALAIPGSHSAQGHSDAHVAQNGVNGKALKFHDKMRKLWEDHVTWTRLFIVSASADLPDLEATTDRLLRNQVHIGNAIKPFYGRRAGNQLTELLTEHILVATDLLGAAKAGDAEGVEQHSARWYRNANEIADFLHAANPDEWPRRAMRRMMREHLRRVVVDLEPCGGDRLGAGSPRVRPGGRRHGPEPRDHGDGRGRGKGSAAAL